MVTCLADVSATWLCLFQTIAADCHIVWYSWFGFVCTFQQLTVMCLAGVSVTRLCLFWTIAANSHVTWFIFKVHFCSSQSIPWLGPDSPWKRPLAALPLATCYQSPLLPVLLPQPLLLFLLLLYPLLLLLLLHLLILLLFLLPLLVSKPISLRTM